MADTPLRPLFVGIGLLVLTNGPVFFVANRVLDNGLSWEEPFTRAVFAALAVAAVAAVAFDRHRLDGARLAAPNPVAAAAIVTLTVWIVVSSLWSLTPELTRGRSLIYVGLAAFAWIIADLDFRGFRRALAVAAFAAVLASMLAVVGSESIGSDFNGDWRGVFTNRNSLAPIAGVAMIASISLGVSHRGRVRTVAAGMGLVSVVALVGSGSRTAALALLVAVGAATLLVVWRARDPRLGPRVRQAALGIGVVGAIVALAVLSRLWSEPTFEQRRTIWRLVRERIADRPWHGYGWFNVWNNPEFTAGEELLGRGSAHGSFFEVWLGLGVVGLVPFLVIVGLALHGVVTSAWRAPSVASWTWLALVFFLLIENLTESFVLWFSYNWVLLMVAALRSDFSPRSRAGRRTPEATPVATG